MKYTVSILLLLLFFGCKGDPGPAGPTLSGNITGRVNLYADNGSRLLDQSGMQLSIDGSSLSCVTSPDGSWQLTGVSAGIYTLVFSKAGFMTKKVSNIQFVGGGTYFFGFISFAQIPPLSVTRLDITGPDSTHAFHLRGYVSKADSIDHYIALIYDKAPIEISSTISFLFYDVIFLSHDSTAFSFPLNVGAYAKDEYRLATGSTLYLRAYALANYADPNYNSATNKLEIYNPEIPYSNLASLIVP